MSSAYYCNSDSGYWPYHQPISDFRSVESVLYPQNTVPQFPPQHYEQPSQLHQSRQQPSPPSYRPDSPLNVPPAPSLLETLLRHGKEAVSKNYRTLSNVKNNNNTITNSNIPPHTPPYTPSSPSDRASPLSALLMDPSSQDRFQPVPQQLTSASNDIDPIGYPQNPYQQVYTASQPRTATCVTSMVTPPSPTAGYDAVHPGYSSYGSKSNNNGKTSPNEASEYTEDQPQRPVDYPWMKSNYANGGQSEDSIN